MLKKFVNVFAILSLLINSLIAPIAVYSQEETPRPEADQPLADTPKESPTPLPTLEPEATPEVTPTPTFIENNLSLSEDAQASENSSLSETPTPEVTSEESHPEADQPMAEIGEPAPSGQSPQDVTPTVSPYEPEKGSLSAVILKETLGESISEFDFEYQEDGSATLITDKSDYAPTDTVLIYGTGFIPNKQYTLEITSDTGNFKFSDTITSDESGSLFYTFQLDGTYRPLYQVLAINSNGEIVAAVTFTDDSPASIPFSSSFGTSNSSTVTNWDESDPAEITGSTSGEDTTRDGTSANKFAKIGEDGWIRRTINATGYHSLQLKYYWKGDADAENSDRGRVEYCSGSTCTSSFTELTNHQLNNTSWSSQQTINLPITLNNTYFRIRFRNDASHSDEYFRVDDVEVIGSLYPSWPTSWTTPACSIDPSGDIGNGLDEIDLIGDASNPAAQYASDSNFRYFRERVNGDPGTFKQKSWVTLYQTSTPQYQYLVSLNGKDDKVQLWQNTSPAGVINFNPLLNDPAESLLWSGDSSIYARRVGPAGGKYFVDWAIPLTVLTGTGIGDATTKFFATSSDANNFNQDHLNCYEGPVTGNLVVHKVFTDQHDNSNITITVTPGSLTQTTNASGDATFNGLAVGTYTAHATEPANYYESANTCINVVVVAGQTTNCTITDSPVAPKLTVTKVVINDNGGIKQVANFPLYFDTSLVTSGVQNTVSVGAHVVSETGDSAYTATVSGDCDSQGNITLNPGDIKSCTITNDDILATLTIVKAVINDNGGAKSASDFAITVTGNNPSPSNFAGDENGTVVTLNAGSYSVDEASDPGYSKNLSADCSGSITVGQSKRCVIINDDIQPELTVTKIITNDNGGTRQISDFPLFVDQTPVASGVENGFNAGNYTVSETQQTGYSSEISGDCASNGLITLNIGDIKSCTITNDDVQPTLKVIKIVINDNGGTAQITDFPLMVGNTSVNSDEVNSFDAGTYFVSETSQNGYSSTFSGDCDRNGQVILSVGDSLKTCTITNDDIQPRLTVTKVVINDNGGVKLVNDFPLFIDQTPVTSGIQNGFNTGTYTVTETQQTGYTSTFSGDCDSNGSTTLALGDVKTCTITNDDQPGLIAGKKFNDVNGNGIFENETGLADWHIQLYQDNNGQIGNQIGTDAVASISGDYLIDNINAGNYFVCEVQQSGWLQTYPSGCHQIAILPGDKWTLNFGNQEIKLGLVLGKSNDKATGAWPGDTVTFGLKTTNTSNQDVHDLKIIDVLPGGFNYVAGSTLIDGSSAPDPLTSGGVLTWNIGTLAQGASVTISYQAIVPSDATAGDYTNLATCQGTGYSTLKKISLGTIECDPNASSQVTVGSSSSFGGSVASAVLGAATVLPATGGSTVVLLLAFAGLAFGIFLKLGEYMLSLSDGKKGRKNEKK